LSERDLGHGVKVGGREGAPVVRSAALDLGWRPPAGPLPGTAVRWRGALWEVVRREAGPWGLRWRLRPWPEGTVARDVVALDRAAVAAAAAAATDARRGARLRAAALVVLPLVGLAPAALQRRWRDAWGFPAAAATRLSALLELVAGGAGVVAALVSLAGAGGVLPRALGWLRVAGPALFGEGLVRLALVAADEEPVGSVFTWPLSLLERGVGAAPSPPPRRAHLGPAGWALRTALLCLAPARHQRAWCARHRLPVTLLTWMGGGAELLGGLSALRADAAAGSAWLALDLLLTGEGALRLLAALSGRPLGSLLGLPLAGVWPRLAAGGGRGPRWPRPRAPRGRLRP